MKVLFRICFSLAALFAAARPGCAASLTITVLHSFNLSDGSAPEAPLLQASDGNFYGTTIGGGDDGNGCVQTCWGTVFKLTPQGRLTLLHTFATRDIPTDGCQPWGGLTEGSDGYLYGTTFGGGAGPCPSAGTFYKVSKTGQFQTLHVFCCTDGGNPQGPLVLGSDGNFYGTTTAPVAFPHVFRITPAGVLTTIKNLYATGVGTPSGLVQASDGNYYGVGSGGVYRITPLGGFSPLYFFGAQKGDGIGGSGSPIQASDSNLYGFTLEGGAFGAGTVFRIGLAGDYQKIHDLSGPSEGWYPVGLLQASDGNLWGITSNTDRVYGGGAVWSITTGGALLQSTLLTRPTGIDSGGPLIQGTDGKLYGTAAGGGAFGYGTVFVVDAGLPPRLTSISIAAPVNSLANGTVEQFTATGTYGDNSMADITTQVTWSTSNNAVAAIGPNTGLATAVAPGSTNITASLNGITSNTFALAVTPAALRSISITGPGSVIVGSTAPFAATGVYSDNSTANITTLVAWKSSNIMAATIGVSTGLATGVAPGSTNITAFLSGVTSNTLSLSVPAPPVVTAFKVIFGSQTYSLTGSPRTRLPWQITGIQVIFSGPVTSGNVSSLSGVTATGLTGLGTNTLTWTINPLAAGNFATALAGSGANALRDALGSPLGGGAGFMQNFKVLLGDFNDDGVVSAADLVGVNNATVAPYNLFADINGDGIVNSSDVLIVRTKIGTSLP